MRLKCVNIVSPNPKRLAEFYKTVLGASIDESHGGPQRIEICCRDDREEASDGNTVLIVANCDAEYTPRATSACQGFEFQVADVDAAYRRIQGLGIEVKEPPKDLPWGYRYFNLKDPDGNGVDIVQALSAGNARPSTPFPVRRWNRHAGQSKTVDSVEKPRV